MRRDDVPEQHLLGEPEFCGDALHCRGGHLGRSCPGQLPLRGEGNPGDAGAAVAGRLADEEERRRRSGGEVPSRRVRRTAAPSPSR
jgi:hypothetical protein